MLFTGSVSQAPSRNVLAPITSDFLVNEHLMASLAMVEA
jgi:hypothetical protein